MSRDMSKYSDEELLEMQRQHQQQAQDKPPLVNPYHPINDMNGIEKFIAGMGRGAHNIGREVAGWMPESWDVGGTFGSDEEMDRLDQPLLDTTAGAAGNLVGEMAVTAPIGGAAATGGRMALGGLGRAAGVAIPRGGPVVGGIARGATEGAVDAAMTGHDAGSGAGWGAAMGGAIPGGSAIWRGLSQPAQISTAARNMERLGRQQNVDMDLTAGQMVDPEVGIGGLVRGVENAINRVPGAGSILTAQRNATSNWNLAEIRRALPRTIRDRVTEPGPRGMEQARRALGSEYDAALRGSNWSITANQGTLNEIADVQDMIQRRIKGDRSGAVLADSSNLFDDLVNKHIDGRNIKTIETALGTKARSARKAGNLDEADAYSRLLTVVRDQRDLAVGPNAAARLHVIDNAYREFMPLRETASSIGAVRQGYFTPDQLAAGSQKIEKQSSKWGAATASNPMTQHALDAGDVFGGAIPQVGPGTAEKLAAQAVIGGVAGAVHGAMSDEGSGVNGAAMGAMGSMFLGALMPRARNAIVGRTAVQRGMRAAQHPLDAMAAPLNTSMGRAAFVSGMAADEERDY